MTPVLAQLLLLAIFPAGVIAAALKDMTSFTIPNWISLALAAAFIPVALLVHMPLGGIGLSLAVGLGALIAGFAMFALGWCGGGDAKLLAAAALWLGLPALPMFLLVTGLAGGALAVGLIMARKEGLLASYAAAGPAWLGRLLTADGDLPYGLAIAVGALAAFPSSALIGVVTRI